MTTYVLVPGMWIGAWAWHDVTDALRAGGHDVYPLTLTGVADRSHLLGPGADLDTHTEDIVRLAEVEDLRDIVLVGHSYGGMPVSVAALRLRDRIKAVVYVDSGPLPEGTTQCDLTGDKPEGDEVPPRDWDPQAELFPMDIDREWGGIPKPEGWTYPAAYTKSRESGEAKAVQEEYAAHYKIPFFGPSPMKKA